VRSTWATLLTCPVGPDDGNAVAPLNLQRHILEQHLPIVAMRQVLDADHLRRTHSEHMVGDTSCLVEAHGWGHTAASSKHMVGDTQLALLGSSARLLWANQTEGTLESIRSTGALAQGSATAVHWCGAVQSGLLLSVRVAVLA